MPLRPAPCRQYEGVPSLSNVRYETYAFPLSSNVVDTSPARRQSEGAITPAGAKVRAESSEYEPAAGPWYTARTRDGSRGSTAIPGSLQGPGAEIVTTRAAGARGSTDCARRTPDAQRLMTATTVVMDIA